MEASGPGPGRLRLLGRLLGGCRRGGGDRLVMRGGGGGGGVELGGLLRR